jgi:hypothetical protein
MQKLSSTINNTMLIMKLRGIGVESLLGKVEFVF